MRQRDLITFVGILLIVAGCAQKELGAMKFSGGKVQHVIRASDINWRPCPPTIPSGCEIVILEGHPGKPDLFSVRFRFNKTIVVPAHTHPKDERVTILKGGVAVGFGRGVKRGDARVFGPGDYYVNARNAIHTVWIEKGAVLQITGVGPWVLDFIDKKH